MPTLVNKQTYLESGQNPKRKDFLESHISMRFSIGGLTREEEMMAVRSNGLAIPI